MTMTLPIATSGIETTVHEQRSAEALSGRAAALCAVLGERSPSRGLEWITILHESLAHEPYCIEARREGQTAGLLPLCYVHTRLFGRFLVGMPYLNVGGVLAQDDDVAEALINEAIRLADRLDVRYLELRHERRWPHAAFNHESTQKVHMRLDLPGEVDELWGRFKPKVRNQIRKAEQNELTVAWGRDELLDEFYAVFATNMRDLGTPVFSRRLFAAILDHLSEAAELCVVRHGRQACAAALLIHGDGVSEVPSASSLRSMNHLNANMLLYWQLLSRAIDRGQGVFDFGRSSADSNTYRFKAQWGAQPHPAVWQYYVRQGSADDMRPDNPKQQRRIRIWQRLPVWFTRLAGPRIIRGIP
jgi:FemAB-related protein (PEP-CTERM system-associated)